ncbi:hypothetical protein [Streptomyces sp. HO565]|uniref:hypothetical protein n=1 Tax=Streptomyces sp. HO565 TaxID=2857489 RepID=UPI0038B591EF
MPEPKPQYVSLSLGKAGVRTLVTLLDQQYGLSGVHVASVTVDGPELLAPTSTLRPSRQDRGLLMRAGGPTVETAVHVATAR